MTMETTMIQLKKDTAQKLKEIKKYAKQSYDEIIRELIQDTTSEKLTEKEKAELEEAMEDIRKGRVYSIKEVAREFNISLEE
ncbi:hypothetical protein HQ533_02970 [Candidatus Woesearchaeota archaeon]|nr:hypothetical protein [Candidatus Woesearchaeota archaeon]